MASRFWVGGTGTWDAATTTHWAATSNGAGGQSVPGSGDTVTFDGSSGGGTVTVNFGGTITVQSITCGAFTGTLDFSANNNSVTMSANSAFSGTGSATRTINLGNGTWTLSATASATIWDFTTTTGLTFNANSSVIALTGAAAGTTTRTFATGALTYATIQVSAAGGFVSLSGGGTVTTLTQNAGGNVSIATNMTITNLNLNGSSAAQVCFTSSTLSQQRTITITTLTATWAAFRSISGSGTATSSFDLGNNAGITITPPSTGSSTGVSRAKVGM